jgi:hypothetical protein
MMRYPAENSGQIWGDYEVAHDYNTTIPVIIVMKKKKEIVTGEGESRTLHRRRARGVADSRSFCQLFCKKVGTVQSFNYIYSSPGCKPASTCRELTANYVRTFTPSPYFLLF